MSATAHAMTPEREFVFTALHEVYYSTRHPVPVADVIEALLGLERLVKMTPKALSALTGVEVQKAEVFVEEIEAGSLTEKVFINFFFKDEAGLEQFIEKARAKVGEGPRAVLLVSSVIAMAALAGAGFMASVSGSSTTNITASNNTIINLGAGEVAMTPERFEAVVRAALPEKKEVAKATLQMLKPARNDLESSIVFDGNEALVLPPEAIAEVPVTYEPGEDILVQRMPGAELLIRATNRDSAVSGWTARIPQHLGKKKVKLVVAPGISLDDIAGRAQVKGDVDVQYKRSPDGKRYVPELITLMRVID